MPNRFLHWTGLGRRSHVSQKGQVAEGNPKVRKPWIVDGTKMTTLGKWSHGSFSIFCMFEEQKSWLKKGVRRLAGHDWHIARPCAVHPNPFAAPRTQRRTRSHTTRRFFLWRVASDYPGLYWIGNGLDYL